MPPTWSVKTGSRRLAHLLPPAGRARAPPADHRREHHQGRRHAAVRAGHRHPGLRHRAAVSRHICGRSLRVGRPSVRRAARRGAGLDGRAADQGRAAGGERHRHGPGRVGKAHRRRHHRVPRRARGARSPASCCGPSRSIRASPPACCTPGTSPTAGRRFPTTN